MANNTGKKFGGRKKGTPNKDIKEIKDIFQVLIEQNLNNLDLWINQVAEKSPEKAINVVLKLSEYILPKVSNAKVIEVVVDEFEHMTDEEIIAEIKRLDDIINMD